MRLIELFWKNEHGMMLSDLAKAAAAIAFLSVVAANFVSSQTAKLDTASMNQVASAISRGKPIDPLVTGSLQKRANETKLDSCAMPR